LRGTHAVRRTCERKSRTIGSCVAPLSVARFVAKASRPIRRLFRLIVVSVRLHS
jgi:hypothetical protein